METFALSKLWYLCQILPMPPQVAQQLTTAAGAFLWRGHLERLAWQELHCPPLEGGLGVSSIATRAQALLAKQFCWAVGQEGEAPPTGHTGWGPSSRTSCLTWLLADMPLWCPPPLKGTC